MILNILSLLASGSTRDVSKFEKWLTEKCGVVILRPPPLPVKELTDSQWDSIMAFHYCKRCKAHRFDRHLDPVSEMERYVCGCCGDVHHTALLAGTSLLYAQECWRVADE